jgi:hypothetical protein
MRAERHVLGATYDGPLRAGRAVRDRESRPEKVTGPSM